MTPVLLAKLDTSTSDVPCTPRVKMSSLSCTCPENQGVNNSTLVTRQCASLYLIHYQTCASLNLIHYQTSASLNPICYQTCASLNLIHLPDLCKSKLNSLPDLCKSNIPLHPSSMFLSFPMIISICPPPPSISEVHFNLTSLGFNLTLCAPLHAKIISFTLSGKIPKIVVKQPHFHQ